MTLPLDTPTDVLAFPLEGTQLIEASAGTGKTYTIANLYLRQVLTGAQVGQLLVVTFTDAATAELRGRIRARLAETLTLLDRASATGAAPQIGKCSCVSDMPAVPGGQIGNCSCVSDMSAVPGGQTRDRFLAELLRALMTEGPQALDLCRRRLRLAVRSMDEAAIYTIHGFAQRALTEFAFLSGQPFQVEGIADDADLWRTALHDWWRRTAYPLDLGRARLLRDALGGPNKSKGVAALLWLIKPMLGAPGKCLLPEVQPLTCVLARVDQAGPVIARLAQEWREDGDDLAKLLTNSKGLSRNKDCPYGPNRLALGLAQVGAWFAAWEAEQEFSPPPPAFEALTQACIDTHRLKRNQDPLLANPYFQLCGELWDTLGTLSRDLKVAALGDAAAFARTQVEEAKARTLTLSFDDLLTRLHAALHRGAGAPGDAPGEALAEAIRRRFPVAMIDEFQDTDPVQYAAFRRIYLGQPGVSLTMIGDPKQAIYGFRGGDIFAYGEAKADLAPGAHYSLGTNWRSTPEAIAAVNALFGRRGAEAFVLAESVPFAPVAPADRTHYYLQRDGKPQTALTLWALPDETDTKGKPRALSKDKARDLTHAALAQEIAALVAEGRAGRARLAGTTPHRDDRNLEPRDIAVLVRSRFEGAEVRKALADWGVRAVSVERTPVFATEEARALIALLAAVLEPGDRALAREALASPLLALGYPRIEALTQGEAAWAQWLDDLLALRETWQRRGFMAMFQGLLRHLGALSGIAPVSRTCPPSLEALSGIAPVSRTCPPSLEAKADPGTLTERRLTNLLHLGELLQQASKAQAGMDALLAWYRARCAEADAQIEGEREYQVRLESDADLVQIVTIHSAKGLEYPVVFLPDLWGCKPRDATGLVAFHEGLQPCLDAGSDDLDAHLRLAERERLAEDLRLVYVALTRARSALYLAWGRVGSKDGHAGQTALGWLLHPHQDLASLLGAGPDAFASLPDLQPDLDALAKAAGGTLRVLPIPVSEAVVPIPAEATGADLSPRQPSRPVPRDWRITSFSELARNVHPGPTPPRDPAATDPALRFPAGSEAGSYLHALLEQIDFRTDVGRQVLDLSARISPRFGMDHQRWGADAATWLELVVNTPLDAQGLSLSRIAPMQRLSEMEFDFAAAGVDIAALNLALQELWPEPQASLDAEGFSGLVTGVIDLVFEHGGRYYIADYKSNFLGPNPEDYAQDRLAAAVLAHRYDLQYLLYTLALHRYLGARLPGYAYERHFGGACYLFLRGMRPETGHRLGVFWARPDLALVERLDLQVFRRPETA